MACDGQAALAAAALRRSQQLTTATASKNHLTHALPAPQRGLGCLRTPLANRRIRFHLQQLAVTAPILDSPRPSQYGPRGLGAAELP
jgi:hypothetical protein